MHEDLECAASFSNDIWSRKQLMKVIIYSKHKSIASQNTIGVIINLTKVFESDAKLVVPYSDWLELWRTAVLFQISENSEIQKIIRVTAVIKTREPYKNIMTIDLSASFSFLLLLIPKKSILNKDPLWLLSTKQWLLSTEQNQ